MSKTKNQGLALAIAAAFACVAQAQTLPPPPTSPTPVATYEYDAQGNPTKTVQAPGTLNFATQASYDTLDRRKDSTDAKLGKTQFGYNGREDLTQVTDPRNLVTQYPRNGLGDATQLVSPDTGTANITYDAAGNVKTRTDSRGVLATYSVDALNRLTSIVYSQSGQASRTYSWAYDQTGTGFSNGIGRLTSTNAVGETTQYAYDPQGRLTTFKQTVPAVSGGNASALTHSVTYAYDAAGHLSAITYPSGRKLSITQTGGQPSAIALAKDASSTATPLISQIQWQPFGPAKSWQWQLASGPQAYTRSFDNSGRLVRYRLGNVVRDLSYDSADRISAYTHYDASSGAAQTALNQSFNYDELGRLTHVTLATSYWDFGYDANGNRTSATVGGATSAYTTQATSNRLTAVTNPARTLAYDAAGNVTSDTYTATYNLENRIRTLTKAGITTTYTYDAQGQRIRKFSSSGSSSTVIFVYDQSGHVLGEYDLTGKAIREYVWLGDTPIAVFTPDPANATNPPLVYFIHADHLDTPRVVVDKNNAIRWRWMAEAFGVTAPETNPSGLGQFTFNLRFPGQYADAESGLFYNYFRSYDSSIGRYTTSDPIGLGGGINTYEYVSGNPLSGIDPKGLQMIIPGGGVTPPPGISPAPGSPGSRPMDPTEPYGPQYTPGWAWPSLPEWAKPWMESRASSEPTLPIVNPGRDCDGNCKPCPPGRTWKIMKPGHGWPNWYEHRIDYNQNKETCMCYPDRPSTGLVGG